METLPFLYKRRIEDYNKRFEFLLLLDTLLIIIFFQVTGRFLLEKPLFYAPLFFLICPIICFFIHLVPAKIWFPWFEKEHLKKIFKNKEKKDFYEEGLREIYGVIGHLGAYYKKRKRLYLLSLNSFLFAIWCYSVVFLIYEKLLCLSLIFSILFFIFILYINLQFDKEGIKQNPSEEVEKFFDELKEEVEKQK